MRSKLLNKILIFILFVVVVVYVIVISFISTEAYFIVRKNVESYTVQSLKNVSRYFSAIIDKDIVVIKTLRDVVKNFYKYDDKKREEYQERVFVDVLNDNPQFLSMGISWELSALDTNYHKPYGRTRYLYYWKHGKIMIKHDTVELEGDKIGSLYYYYKTSKQPGLTPIYTDTYTGLKQDEVLMTSIVEPILVNDRFYGAVYADISLERMHKIISAINLMKESKTILFSQNGKIIASTGNEPPLTPIYSLPILKNKKALIVKNLNDNKDLHFVITDSLKKKYFVAIIPVKFHDVKETWGLLTVFPLSFIQKETSAIVKISVIGGIIGLIMLIIIITVVALSIVRPIKEIVSVIQELSDRNISVDLKLPVKTKDEIGVIAQSVNELIDALLEVTKFADEIGKGNLEVKLKLAGKNDVLGQALIEMQKSLKIARIEDKKRQEEEKIQRWVVEGEAKFAEILRQYNRDLETLAYQTIKNLVNYTGAVQGGLFIINDDDPENKFIELIAAYAYGRRKFLKKTMPLGAGLIGRSVLEGETIYLTEIPEDYTTITSGLGETKPRSLIIVPFKFNEVIYAVAELASLNEFKPYVRNFIERVGVSIASTIANVKITIQTSRYVEELKARTQELMAQEEEMRQNLEEMKVTQDELRRKSQELENIVNALYQVAFVIEYDMDRRIINANQRFLDFLGVSREEILGTQLGAYMIDPNKEKKLEQLWKDILLGNIRTLTQHHEFNGKEFWFVEAYIPVFDEEGKPYKVINIINDITSVMKQK